MFLFFAALPFWSDIMSSRFRPILVSPSYALFVLAFSHMVLAENTEQGKLVNTNSTAAKAAVTAARELIELMADRLELNEAIARIRWNDGQRGEDEKLELILSDSTTAAIKEAGLEQVWAQAVLKGQMLAARDFQRQRFASWKTSGVYAFDDLPDSTVDLRAQLEKNAQDQIKKLQELKGVLCSTAMIAYMSETASVVFARRKIENQLLKPVMDNFDVHAREETGSCPNAHQGLGAAPHGVQVQHAVNRVPN